jgi:hypothetical protein
LYNFNVLLSYLDQDLLRGLEVEHVESLGAVDIVCRCHVPKCLKEEQAQMTLVEEIVDEI